MAGYVIISYSRGDRAYADRLAAHLAAHLDLFDAVGVPVWMAREIDYSTELPLPQVVQGAVSIGLHRGSRPSRPNVRSRDRRKLPVGTLISTRHPTRRARP